MTTSRGVLARAGAVLAALAAACSDDGTADDAATTANTTGASGSTSAGAGTDDGSSGDAPDATDPTGSNTSDPTADPGTDSGATELDACRMQCSADADCFISGGDFGFVCGGEGCLLPCEEDDTCVAFFSLWQIEPCAASSDCDRGTCVVYGQGDSGCALTPDDGSCADLELQEIERMNTEGEMVTVCAEPRATCVDTSGASKCVLPCSDFVDCYSRGTGDTCSDDGQCVYACTQDADCSAESIHDNVTWTCG